MAANALPKRILIVEENLLNPKLLKDLLEYTINVVATGSGEAAIDLAVEHQPDLILMDVIPLSG